MSTPSSAIALVRISDARNGDTHGVDGQIADLYAYADRIGWGIGPRDTHLIVENDISAYKRQMCTMPDGTRQRRPKRPDFWRALAMLRDGRADGLLAIDLDRVCRDPRDLEDLIDIRQTLGLLAESVTGTLRLVTTSDIAMARMMLAAANKASADTARRVSESHRRRAAEGKYRGGQRRFGWDVDGVTPQLFAEPVKWREGEFWAGEQDVIRWAAGQVLTWPDYADREQPDKSGQSLRYLVRRLDELAVPTVTGAAWSTSTLRDILLRPSNAGISVWTDPETRERKELAVGGWEPVLDRDVWEAVCEKLTEAARRSTPGNKPRWLGSLIYQCGACSNGETVSVAGGRQYRETYVCRGYTSHLRRVARPVDDLVEKVIVARLSKPDAVDLLPSAGPGAADMAALRSEAAALRERLDALGRELGRLFASGSFDTRQVEASSREMHTRLAVVDAQLAEAAGSSPLAGIAGNPEAAKVWDGLDMGRKREIVKAVVVVTLLPVGKLSGRVFDPESVDIEWRRKLSGEL